MTQASKAQTTPAPKWKHDGVRVIPAHSLDPNTAQTPGMDRKAAINFARAGAGEVDCSLAIHAGRLSRIRIKRMGGNDPHAIVLPFRSVRGLRFACLRHGEDSALITDSISAAGRDPRPRSWPDRPAPSQPPRYRRAPDKAPASRNKTSHWPERA